MPAKPVPRHGLRQRRDLDLSDTRVTEAGLKELEETLTEWWNGAVEKGRKEGRQKGRETGQLEGMRKLLLRQLEQRFETVPARVRRKVKAISSAKELEDLAKRILVAPTLAEMGLGWLRLGRGQFQ